MDYFIIVLLILVVIGLGLLFFLLLKKKTTKQETESLVMLQQQLNQLSQTLDNKLSESAKSMRIQSSQSAKIVRDVTERLTKLDDTNKRIIDFAKQMQSLENILTNPKQRGILGEYFLETVLKNVLPPESYKIQYSFKDGTIVDAVVFIDKQIIPIDSKFSLENYNRILDSHSSEEKKRYEAAFINDLKFRIDETSKYVKPEEKTMDFAFMYIPSEAVYYDLLINKVGVVTGDTNNLVSYAGRKKVIIVSPTSFLAYLQTVLQGLRRQKISEQAIGIIKEVDRLGKHLGAYSQHMQKLGNHLTITVGSYNKANKELKKIDKDVVKITDGKPQIEIKEIEKPSID